MTYIFIAMLALVSLSMPIASKNPPPPNKNTVIIVLIIIDDCDRSTESFGALTVETGWKQDDSGQVSF